MKVELGFDVTSEKMIGSGEIITRAKLVTVARRPVAPIVDGDPPLRGAMKRPDTESIDINNGFESMLEFALAQDIAKMLGQKFVSGGGVGMAPRPRADVPEAAVVKMNVANSSNVAEIAYDERTKKCRVRFTNGGFYESNGTFESYEFHAFVQAPSKGEHFAKHLKPRGFSKVEEPAR